MKIQTSETYIYTYGHTCTHIHVYVHVCIHIYICICMCTKKSKEATHVAPILASSKLRPPPIDNTPPKAPGSDPSANAGSIFHLAGRGCLCRMVCLYVCEHIHVYDSDVYVCVFVCVCVCVCLCVCGSVRVYIYIYTYIIYV